MIAYFFIQREKHLICIGYGVLHDDSLARAATLMATAFDILQDTAVIPDLGTNLDP